MNGELKLQEEQFKKKEKEEDWITLSNILKTATTIRETLYHKEKCSIRIGLNSIASTSIGGNAFFLLKCIIDVIVTSQEN